MEPVLRSHILKGARGSLQKEDRKTGIPGAVRFGRVRGPGTVGKAVHASVLTVMDFGGKQVLDYAVDDGRNSNGEQLPLRDEKGVKAHFMFGFANPLPGSPFLFTAEEVI